MTLSCPVPSRRRFPLASRLRPIALAVLFGLGPGAAPAARADAAAGLTLAEAERIAIQRDAMLRQLDSESSAMRERAVAEGELMDPQLRLGALNLPVDSFALDEEDMTMLEVGVSQAFGAGNARRLARERMEHSALAVDASAADRRRTVQRELRRAWAELAFLRAARDEVASQQPWIEQMRASARARYAAGEGRQLELLQAGLDAAMLREQLLDLDRDEAMYRAQLGRWLGEDVAAGPLEATLPARAEPPPLAELELRLDRHPTQLDFEQRIRAAESGVELAKQRYKPSWMLDLSYGFRGGEGMDGASRSDLASAMITVDLPLFRARRQDREVAAARAEARGVHEMHEDHRREMQAMLDEAWVRERRTYELEQLYERELLPLAGQSVRAALLAYGSNRAMVDEVIAARRAALEARLKHLRLAADRAQARFDIDYLAGDAP